MPNRPPRVEPLGDANYIVARMTLTTQPRRPVSDDLAGHLGERGR